MPRSKLPNRLPARRSQAGRLSPVLVLERLTARSDLLFSPKIHKSSSQHALEAMDCELPRSKLPNRLPARRSQAGWLSPVLVLERLTACHAAARAPMSVRRIASDHQGTRRTSGYFAAGARQLASWISCRRAASQGASSLGQAAVALASPSARGTSCAAI